MHFICSITHTLIKKNDTVRIFFIESHNNPSFPFMNYHAPTSTTNFKPLGCAFKAKMVHSDHNEYFTFNMDGKESPAVDCLLNYINKKMMSKSEAKEANLLSHHSKNITWGYIDSLEELFVRCNTQSVYLKNNREYKPFVTAMIMHESAYKTILKHSDMEHSLDLYKKKTKEEDYIQNKEWIENFIQKEREMIEGLKGQTHEGFMEETLMYDQATFEHMMKEIAHFKDHENQKYRDSYLKIKEEESKKIGTEQTVNIRRERLVDDEYIEFFMKDTIEHMYKINEREATAFKEATYNFNSDNYLATLQISNLFIHDKFKKSEWLPIFESYLIEIFLTYNGYEFLPSRRHYQYQQIKNKAFFKELTELKVYR